MPRTRTRSAGGDDLVELMLGACANIERTAGQVYNVGGGPANTISVWTELRKPMEHLGCIHPPVSYGQLRPGDWRIYVSDIPKAPEDLSWTLRVGVIDGFRLMLQTQTKDWKTAQAQ